MRVDGEEMLSLWARLDARPVAALLLTREEVLGLRKCRREATVSRLWLLLRSRKLPKLDEIVESRFRFLLGRRSEVVSMLAVLRWSVRVGRAVMKC